MSKKRLLIGVAAFRRLSALILLGAFCVFVGDICVRVLAQLAAKSSLITIQEAKNSELLKEAQGLEEQAEILAKKRDFDGAISLTKRALEILERTLSSTDPKIALSLSNLGYFYYSKGDYVNAEANFSRALAIREKAVPPDDALVAESLSDLAAMITLQGDYVRPEPLYQRALSITERAVKARKQAETELVPTLNNLATLYENRGDYTNAEPLFSRALAIQENASPKDNLGIALALNNLGRLYLNQRKYDNAESVLKRALKIYENAAPQGTGRSNALNNLATVYYNRGAFDAAEGLFQQALALREQTIGPKHPDLSSPLINLANVFRMQHRYDQAQLLLNRALAVTNEGLGHNHPNTGNVVHYQSLLYQAKGNVSEAVATRKRTNDIREYNLGLILSAGSEAQKRLYLDTLKDETDVSVSLHFREAPTDERAAALSVTTVLQRKGRVLDVMSNTLEALRRRAEPEDRALLEELSSLRSRLAKMVLSGGGTESASQRESARLTLEAETQRLEAKISYRSAAFRAQSQEITLELVQKAIPEEFALVEFISYRPFDVFGNTNEKSFGPRHYGAYVLQRSGKLQWVSLGSASTINSRIARFRNALRDPKQKDVKQLGKELDEKLMRPVRVLLGDVKNVFLSPDSDLSLIPFDALVDEQDEYLIKTYNFSYLTSGRDLLRLQITRPNRGVAVVIADPVFDNASLSSSQVKTEAKADATSIFSSRELEIKPLPGTKAEARALSKILRNAIVITGSKATEAAVKQVRGPSILHLATHGFFFPDKHVFEAQTVGKRGLQLVVSTVNAVLPYENSLVRSGLIFAGVKQGLSGPGEDGVLTALESSGLDLWGTKLVVLSACDTGVGDVADGDGVYGLRRSLVLAGAETQMMSLWPVNDKATRDLMVSYYDNLRAGAGRTEALRSIQRKMINSPIDAGKQNRGLGLEKKLSADDRSHPFYWASFIVSGNWRPVGIETIAR